MAPVSRRKRFDFELLIANRAERAYVPSALNHPRPVEKNDKAQRRLLTALSVCFLSVQISAASPNLDLARQLNQAFVEVAEKVSPAVVVITVITKPGTTPFSDLEQNPEDAFQREFWRQFRRQAEPDSSQREIGQGSGVIIRENGFILTNRHVVDQADSIEVRLKDGRKFKAQVHGVDPQSDVAVIRIDAKGLPVAKLAESSKTRVGEFAIAIGAPFQLDYSVTFGHVSAKGRGNVVPSYHGGGMLDQDFIQTDANINPGNSGGPLVNIEGEVIGINTLIRGFRTGIGFAIPSSLAHEVSDQIIANGKFTRAWLGVSIGDYRNEDGSREQTNVVKAGVIVWGVLTNGPAAKSDLRRRDVITAVDGDRVTTVQELRNEVRGKPIGQPVTLDVFRNGKALKVKVTAAEWMQSDHADLRKKE